MDDPFPDSWWWNDEDKVYIKVRDVVTSNHSIGPYVSIEVYEKDGALKPNASGIGQSRWNQMVMTGDLQLLASPPWIEAEELTLEEEPALEAILPERATCNVCGSTDLQLYRGPLMSEHRWICRGCWKAYDYIEYNLIGGDADLEVKTA